MKKCSKCQITKNFNDFNKNKSSKDGKQRYCRSCSNSYLKKYNPEYFKLNKEKEKERKNIWIQNNKDLVSEEKKRYRIKNKSKIRLDCAKRRSKKNNNGSFFISSKEINKILLTSCNFCNSIKDIQIDHIIPISKGGRHSIGNIQPLCGKCNREKGAMLWVEFIAKSKSEEHSWPAA